MTLSVQPAENKGMRIAVATLSRQSLKSLRDEPAEPSRLAAARAKGAWDRERGVPLQHNRFQLFPGSWRRTRDLAAAWEAGWRGAAVEAAAAARVRRTFERALALSSAPPPILAGGKWGYRPSTNRWGAPAILRPRAPWAAALAPPLGRTERFYQAWRRWVGRLAIQVPFEAERGERSAIGYPELRPSGGWRLAAFEFGRGMTAAHRYEPN